MALPATVSELRDSLQRARASIARHKEEVGLVTTRFMTVGKVSAGAVGSGALRAFFGNKLPGLDLPADLALGTAISLAGVAGVADKASDDLALFGAGLAAPGLAEESERFFKGIGK